MDNMKIADFLKSLRKAKGLTQSEVAEALYVTQKTVSRWETGEGIPDITILTTVASFYGITVDELLNGERKKENLSEYTNNIKSLNRSKLIMRKLNSRLNLFSLIAYIVGGLFLTLDLIVGICGYQKIGVILGLLGLGLSIIIYIAGAYLNKDDLRNADIDLTDSLDTIKREGVSKTVNFFNIFSMMVAIYMGIYLLFLLLNITSSNYFNDELVIEELILTALFFSSYLYFYKNMKIGLLEDKLNDKKLAIEKLYNLGSFLAISSILLSFSLILRDELIHYELFLNIFAIFHIDGNYIIMTISYTVIAILIILIFTLKKYRSASLLLVALILGVIMNAMISFDFETKFMNMSLTIAGGMAIILTLLVSILIFILKSKLKNDNKEKIEE